MYELTENSGAELQSRSLFVRIADWVYGFDFFVSYAHADGSEYARQLKADLETRGFRVFLDEHEYAPGVDLRRATLRRVGMSRHLIVLGRPRALQSDWVMREVEAHLAKRRIPIVVNFGGAVTSAATTSALAQLAVESHWLRIEEPDARATAPTSATLDSLTRRFRSTRAERRRVRFFQALSTVFAVLLVFVTLGFWQASRQRDRAEANFEAALTGVDALIRDLAGEGKSFQGVSSAVIRSIFETAEDVTARLNTSGANASLEWRIAAIKSGLSQVAARMEQKVAALDYALEAEALFERTLPQVALDAQMGEELIGMYVNLAEAHKARRDFAAAAAAYEEAEAFASALPAEIRSDPKLAAAAAIARRHRGDLELLLAFGTDDAAYREHLGAAADFYESARSELAALHAADPDSVEIAINYAMTLHSLADVDIEDRSRALSFLETAKETLTASATRHPNHMHLRRQLASLRRKIGRSKMYDFEEFEAAIFELTQAIALYRRILEDDIYRFANYELLFLARLDLAIARGLASPDGLGPARADARAALDVLRRASCQFPENALATLTREHQKLMLFSDFRVRLAEEIAPDALSCAEEWE